MKQLMFVFIGGGAGSVLRYLVSKWINTPVNTFPYGTLAANFAGCLCIGLILGWAIKTNNLSSNTSLLLATGFCGGLTTFSTFAFENLNLIKNSDFINFSIYTLGSIAMGVAAVFLGIWLSKNF